MTELFETYILTPLFETKTILSLFNNHYYYMTKATFGRITQYAWSICGESFGVIPAGDYEFFGSFGGKMSVLIYEQK